MTILGFIGAPEIIFIFIFIGIIFLLPLIALIDIVIHEFTDSNKLIWVLIVLLLPLLGAILYFIIGMKQKLPK